MKVCFTLEDDNGEVLDQAIVDFQQDAAGAKEYWDEVKQDLEAEEEEEEAAEEIL
jgi:hypothetical protein